MATSAKTPVQIDVDIVPNPIFIMARIEGLSRRLKSYRAPLTEAVKEVAIPSIWENFAQEGRPPWDRLTQETAHIRSELGYGAESPILIRTGKLFRAATAFARWKITRDTAEVSNWPASVWYGPIHQVGAESGGSDIFGSLGGIPARPFMQLTPGDERDIEKVFSDWVAKQALAEGFVAV